MYVDDLFLFGANISGLEDIQQKLHYRFKMTDLGDISLYLGMEVDYVFGDKITLCQSSYLKKILERFKITRCKPATVFIKPGVANSLFFYDGNAQKATIK